MDGGLVLKKQQFLSILLGIGALSLSACETGWNGQNSQINVQTHDEAVMTPAPLPSDSSGSSMMSGDPSVEIYDGMQDYASTMNYDVTTAYNNNGVLASDPSVTIYSLDDQMPMGAAPSYAMPTYNNAGLYPPMNSYGTMNQGTENQIYFKHGSSRLGSGDLRKLSDAAEQAKFAPVNRITVSGHASQPTQAGTQTVEAHILNLKESMNRSFAVSKTLMQKGVPAEKIKTVSWGATQPTGDESQDRRVDIVMGEQ